MIARQPQTISSPQAEPKASLDQQRLDQQCLDEYWKKFLGSLSKDSAKPTSILEHCLNGGKTAAWSSITVKRKRCTADADLLPEDRWGLYPRKRNRETCPSEKPQGSCLTGNLTPTFAPEWLLKDIELVDRSGKYPSTFARASPANNNPAQTPLITVESLTVKMSMLSFKQAHFRFLDLPGEIRNQIYRLVINHPSIRIPTEAHRTWRPGLFDLRKSRLLQPNITRVSRQLRTETLPIFYAENTFVFEMSLGIRTVFSRWVHVIGPVNASCLTTVRMRLAILSHSHDVTPQFCDMIVKLAKDRSFLYLGMSIPLPPQSQNALAGPVRGWLCRKKNLTGCDLLTLVAAMLHWGGRLRLDSKALQSKKQLLYPVKFFPDLQSTSESATASTGPSLAYSLRLMEAAMGLDFKRCEPHLNW